MINGIQDYITTIMAELNKENEIPLPVVSFPFNCSNLINKPHEEIARFEQLIKDKKLDNSRPIIYWFEINSIKDSVSLIDEIDTYRKTKEGKVPPTNSKNISDNILYVGKVRKNFKGRINQHLGYGSKNTWSLQLKHWASDLGLNLTLNYIQLSETQSDIKVGNIKLAIYEQCVAEKLNPILGKHSL